ncbi:hypothetical protein ABW20_dc0107179 [Dactylellina cionopaga]|nr:hypothetical protein ABW20_dc0107179 [Dactylellina cionopaga]
MQIAISNVENQAAVVVGIEKITWAMGRYSAYEGLYLGRGLQHQSALEASLVKLYSCILRFLIKAKEFYEMPQSNLKRISATFLITQPYADLFAEIDMAEKLLMEDVKVVEAQRKHEF